jgi:hypothetical protein
VFAVVRVPLARCKRNVLSVLDVIAGRIVIYDLLLVP